MTRFAELPGSRIHYDDVGQGDAVVLLHGLGLDLRMWDDQVRALATRYRVYAPDLLGSIELVEGDKRILVDAGRTRTAAPVNEAAAKFLAQADPKGKPIVVHGPAWLLLEEESWFCLWHRLNDDNDLRGKVEPLVRGDHIV